MAVLKILHYPSPVLLKVGKPVQVFDANLEALVSDMFETMYDARGVGLAAPQVGISKRLFVMDCSAGEDPSRRFVIINPEIVATEGSQVGKEGCLSFPGVYTDIKREMRVVVRFQNLKGEWQELDVTGLEARCVLHETDHCDGIVFLDRMTPIKRAMAKRKIKEYLRSAESVD